MTEVFPQIGASINIREPIKSETTLVQIPKMLKKYCTMKYRVKIQWLQKMILQCHMGNTYGESIEIMKLYEKSVYEKAMLSSEEAGIKFIDLVSRLMTKWLQDSPLKNIAFKAIIEMLSRLLQRPLQKSKSKDHQRAWEGRMKLRESGELVLEQHQPSTKYQINLVVK